MPVQTTTFQNSDRRAWDVPVRTTTFRDLAVPCRTWDLGPPTPDTMAGCPFGPPLSAAHCRTDLDLGHHSAAVAAEGLGREWRSLTDPSHPSPQPRHIPSISQRLPAESSAAGARLRRGGTHNDVCLGPPHMAGCDSFVPTRKRPPWCLAKPQLYLYRCSRQEGAPATFGGLPPRPSIAGAASQHRESAWDVTLAGRGARSGTYTAAQPTRRHTPEE